MKLLFAARGCYDQHSEDSEMSWAQYKEWSRLIHLTELISLDGMLNEDLIIPDHQNADDWNYIVTDEEYVTGFFSSLDYVLDKIKPVGRFNLLAVAIRPEADCSLLQLDGYSFIGYELLDKDYGISALSNCGGFDETFLPSELNHFGLIDDYHKAVDICKRLVANNPNEHHADTNVIAVWRHQTIGKAQG